MRASCDPGAATVIITLRPEMVAEHYIVTIITIRTSTLACFEYQSRGRYQARAHTTAHTFEKDATTSSSDDLAMPFNEWIHTAQQKHREKVRRNIARLASWGRHGDASCRYDLKKRHRLIFCGLKSIRGIRAGPQFEPEPSLLTRSCKLSAPVFEWMTIGPLGANAYNAVWICNPSGRC